MEREPTPKELLAVIRAHCLECSGGSRMDVRTCKVKRCKLWPYRMVGSTAKKSKTKKTYEQIDMFEFMSGNDDGNS